MVPGSPSLMMHQSLPASRRRRDSQPSMALPWRSKPAVTSAEVPRPIESLQQLFNNNPGVGVPGT